MIMELQEKLARGEQVYGTMLSEIYVPNIARLLQVCGFEFLIADCEHGYFDYAQIADIIAVADGVGLPVIVRTAAPDRSALTKYMDMGARGILLANTESVEDARKLVNSCLYAPEGDRGVSTFRAHTGYNPGNLTQTMQIANRRNLVICQIESAQAAEIADDLLQIPGVSGLLVGPNDLTQHMGLFGQYEHPAVQAVLAKVAAAARQAGKWSGIITADAQLIARCKDLGMQFYSAGSELNMIAAGAREILNKLKH